MPATARTPATPATEPVPATTARLFLAASRLLRSVRRPDPEGLGNGTLSALATLVTAGPMRLGDLASCEQVAAPTMTRIVAVLTDAGYVRADPDPSDRRARLVRATANGERVVTERHTASISELQVRFEQLPQEQRDRLRAALPALETLVAPTGHS